MVVTAFTWVSGETGEGVNDTSLIAYEPAESAEGFGHDFEFGVFHGVFGVLGWLIVVGVQVV